MVVAQFEALYWVWEINGLPGERSEQGGEGAHISWNNQASGACSESEAGLDGKLDNLLPLLAIQGEGWPLEFRQTLCRPIR